MRTATRLALFALALSATFGLGAGLGAAVGPITIGGGSGHVPGNQDPGNQEPGHIDHEGG